MDELLRDFLTETHESIDVVDVELVRFEQDPNNAKILDNIFRLVHTIKGTCGFLALPRLEALTHAAEALMGKFRAGAPVTAPAVTLILATLDRIKQLLEELEQNRTEPAGGDDDLIAQLRQFAAHGKALPAALPQAVPPSAAAGDSAADPKAEDVKPEDRIANQSIRVQLDTLEHLMAMVSELVLTRNQLLDIMRRNGESEF